MRIIKENKSSIELIKEAEIKVNETCNCIKPIRQCIKLLSQRTLEDDEENYSKLDQIKAVYLEMQNY